jgi:hypothetical protein
MDGLERSEDNNIVNCTLSSSPFRLFLPAAVQLLLLDQINLAFANADLLSLMVQVSLRVEIPFFSPCNEGRLSVPLL